MMPITLARWEEIKAKGYKCSNCKFVAKNKTGRCPKCKAIMDEILTKDFEDIFKESRY